VAAALEEEAERTMRLCDEEYVRKVGSKQHGMRLRCLARYG
jgi:hypothetical protein